MYINCLTLDLNIYASSLWLAASLLTLGMVELLKNRWYWRFFIITAEMSTNKEVKINHWHTYCHYAQHTPQTHTPYRESLKYYPPPKRRCRLAGPGATVSLCRWGRIKEQLQQDHEMVDNEPLISRNITWGNQHGLGNKANFSAWLRH